MTILSSVIWSHLLSENLLLLGSVLIFAAMLMMKAGEKLGVPALFLFLILGMVIGADGLGLKFEDHALAESMGHFAMTIILFTAGLETSMEETKPVMASGITLSMLGIFLMTLLTGFFVYLIAGTTAGFTLPVCFLFGAIMSSPDSASVFSVLRCKRLHLRENLGPMLELESGSNDPMAMMLTILLLQFVTNGNPEAGSWSQVLSSAGLFLLQIGIGVVVGQAMGFLSKWMLSKIAMPSGALCAIFILSSGFFANGIAGFMGGNRLLALYITAIIIGNKAKIKYRKEVISFFDGMTWLMQLAMFMMLGLLARPSQMLTVLLPALLIGIFMIFVARPASVFLSLLPFKNLSARAKLFTSWVGIKGAGPILFAMAPVVAGLEGADLLFNTVLVITMMSLLVQGTTLRPVARLLRLSYDEDPAAETFGMEVPEEMGMLRDHIVTEDDLAGGATLRNLSLPHGIRVMMVKREGRFLVPHGSMQLQAGDRLVIIMGDSDD